MKLRIKKRSLTDRDAAKARRINQKLEKLSLKNRKKELAVAKVREPEPAETTLLPATVPGAKVTVNVSGNRRGMQHAGDSEHMRKIRAMRKMYNKQMPVLQCSNCSFSSSCPQFKAGYECAFLPFLNSHKVDSEEDLVEYMKELIGAQMRRTHLSLIMETLSGAPPSLELSEAMNLSFMQLKTLHETLVDKTSVTVEMNDDGGTIIGRLFGGLNNLIDHTEQVKLQPVDVPPIRPVETESTLGLESAKDDVNYELVREHSTEEVESVIRERKAAENKQANVEVSDLK